MNPPKLSLNLTMLLIHTYTHCVDCSICIRSGTSGPLSFHESHDKRHTHDSTPGVPMFKAGLRHSKKSDNPKKGGVGRISSRAVRIRGVWCWSHAYWRIYELLRLVHGVCCLVSFAAVETEPISADSPVRAGKNRSHQAMGYRG